MSYFLALMLPKSVTADPQSVYQVGCHLFLFFHSQQQLGICQPPRGRRPPTRNVAVQKEVCTFGPDGRTKTVMLVDAAQQTGKKPTTTIENAQPSHAPKKIVVAKHADVEDWALYSQSDHLMSCYWKDTETKTIHKKQDTVTEKSNVLSYRFMLKCLSLTFERTGMQNFQLERLTCDEVNRMMSPMTHLV